MRREDYPPDWEAISIQIREVRAKGRCEQCGVKNHAYVYRLIKDQYRYATGCELLQLTVLTHLKSHGWRIWRALRYMRLTKIILTVAHLDRDPTNNSDDNLKALCQRCHLGYDMPQHVRNRKYGRDHDRPPQLTLPWFDSSIQTNELP
ncbi:hypothetical protein G8759_31220 [Spirosoma aureum]|uniref:HNH endonuclease n=1 Tax=Spirosoma aureum TaxID=2692134 RepID=A0A6G9AWX1_9BACT|nr:hypothetical protein [Spirosoma aureum]QIP16795.1 hypothetical protein G8759_31220 [Spirosoma aureum]